MKIEAFKVIGISVRTSNLDGKAMQDIPAIWQKFMGENIMSKIPNKVNNDIYAVYTKYDGDHNKPYTMVLGCKVSSTEEIPEGMISHEIATGEYKQFTAKGNLEQGVVYQEWKKIWELESELNRAYTSDLEIYGAKSQNPADAEVDIFIAV